jgi:hypothetical protein
VSETSENGTPETVSMTKKSRPTAAGRKPPVDNLPLPTTMKAAMAALVLVVVGSIARGVNIALTSESAFRAYEIHTNAKQKKPKKPYTAQDISSDIHALKSSYLVYALIGALVVAFLIFGLRKARSASGSRWVLIFGLFFTGALGGIVPPFAFPGIAQGLGVAVGVLSIISIGLVFSPPSSVYSKACREAALPPELRGQPRPKLFGPRPTPASRQAPTRPTSTRGAAPGPTATSTGGGRSKAKARSDAEAVARGADLARSRARASKSRRSDV